MKTRIIITAVIIALLLMTTVIAAETATAKANYPIKVVMAPYVFYEYKGGKTVLYIMKNVTNAVPSTNDLTQNKLRDLGHYDSYWEALQAMRSLEKTTGVKANDMVCPSCIGAGSNLMNRLGG
jgi:Skp family chaperone for outer membrane proteins